MPTQTTLVPSGGFKAVSLERRFQQWVLPLSSQSSTHSTEPPPRASPAARAPTEKTATSPQEVSSVPIRQRASRAPPPLAPRRRSTTSSSTVVTCPSMPHHACSELWSGQAPKNETLAPSAFNGVCVWWGGAGWVCVCGCAWVCGCVGVLGGCGCWVGVGVLGGCGCVGWVSVWVWVGGGVGVGVVGGVCVCPLQELHCGISCRLHRLHSAYLSLWHNKNVQRSVGR